MVTFVKWQQLIWTYYLSLCSLQLAAFDICLLNEIEQQTILARTLGPFKIDPCRVLETLLQNFSPSVTLQNLDETYSSHFTLRILGDLITSDGAEIGTQSVSVRSGQSTIVCAQFG